jgi:F420-dependent oxidoreductase-like protein
MPLRLPAPGLIVLIGPSGAGKSHWAGQQFRPEQIVSSDAIRALVGEGRDDQRAGGDAFEVLDLVLERRLARGLVTVLDTLGLDATRRRDYLAKAHQQGVAGWAVVFDTPPDICRARNRGRADRGGRPVPPKVLAAQFRSHEHVRAELSGEGWDGLAEPDDVVLVPAATINAPQYTVRQREDPMPLRFGLQLPSFTWYGGPPEMANHLTEIAAGAETAGFTSIWVMDHFLQIPPVGREWEDMLESWTTLGFLAARTATARIGTLVTGVTYRNVAHLAKMAATLDVLSGGRAVCGLGAAWFEREHRAYGWSFPPRKQRFALLEDALQLLPLMWGPGSPAFEGAEVSVPEAICYPRPLQERIPILVGGSGEQRTLRLVARYADACNLFGDAATVRGKLDVLARHCADAGRDVDDIAVTHLSTALVAEDPASLAATVERLRPRSASPEAWSARVNAATVDDHIGRFRQLAEAGVHTAIVSLPDVSEPGALDRIARVIAAFPPPVNRDW